VGRGEGGSNRGAEQSLRWALNLEKELELASVCESRNQHQKGFDFLFSFYSREGFLVCALMCSFSAFFVVTQFLRSLRAPRLPFRASRLRYSCV